MKSLCCFSNKSEEQLSNGRGPSHPRTLRPSSSFHVTSTESSSVNFFNPQSRTLSGVTRVGDHESPHRANVNQTNGRALSFVQSISSPFRDHSLTRMQTLGIGQNQAQNGNPPYQNLFMRNIGSPTDRSTRSVDDENVLYSILPNSRSTSNMHSTTMHSPSQFNNQISHPFASPNFYSPTPGMHNPLGGGGNGRFCHCESSRAFSSELHYHPHNPPFRFMNGEMMQPKILTQREYIHFLIPDQKCIVNSSFYWGKMDRHEAELLLNGKPEGAFLLRDSVQDDFTFSISFRRYSRTLHARIEQHKHHFSLDSHDPNVYQSRTINGLLEHYKVPESSLFFEPLLTLPQKRKQPFTLKALARAALCDHVSYDAITFLEIPSQLKDYLREYNYKQVVSGRRFDPFPNHFQCLNSPNSSHWVHSHGCHVTAPLSSPFALHQPYTPGVFGSNNHANGSTRGNFGPTGAQLNLHQPAFSPSHNSSRARPAFYHMNHQHNQRGRCNICNLPGNNNNNSSSSHSNYSHTVLGSPSILQTLSYSSPNNAD